MNLNNIIKKTSINIQGRFSSNDIACYYKPINLLFSNKEKKCIENQWNKTRQKKSYIFNGQLFHIQGYQLLKSKIKLCMTKSNFKEYVGTRSYEFQRLFGQSKIIKPISVGTMIITSDNKWIIGRRESSTYTYAGNYNFVAGYMDPSKDIVNCVPNPFFSLKREMNEETGIHDEYLDTLICLGIVGENQPYMAFFSILNITFDKFNHMIPKEKEFISLEGFDLTKKAIENFIIHNYDKLTPHALGNLLMYYSLEL
jgi:8-oxo-dGTP pyrophosphatase MutT (NUDIX family)